MSTPYKGCSFYEMPQYLLKVEEKRQKMAENTKKYDLIIQNNASRATYVFSGLTDLSNNDLFYQFEFEIGVAEGEYTYALLRNDRDDVTYDFRIPILDTIVHTEEGDVVLSDLQPPTGLLRVGDTIEVANIYDNTAYSGQTTDENNTIFYYEG